MKMNIVLFFGLITLLLSSCATDCTYLSNGSDTKMLCGDKLNQAEIDYLQSDGYSIKD